MRSLIWMMVELLHVNIMHYHTGQTECITAWL